MSNATELVLFRHGIAEDAAERRVTDRQRHLTAEGRRRTQLAALGLARWLDGPVEILTSPLVRAQETAAILADVMEAVPQDLEALAPGEGASQLLGSLGASNHGVTRIAVGHEPDLSGCIAAVVGGERASAFEVKKAAACGLSLDAQGGAVRWLLPPRLLRQLGGDGAAGSRTG